MKSSTLGIGVELRQVQLSGKALLFDMDGTLIDSTAVVERLWASWAHDHSVDPAEVLAATHGRQARAIIEDFLPHLDESAVLAEADEMIARETRETDGIVAIAGTRDLLTSAATIPHALVTSATSALAGARTRAAGLEVPRVAVTSESVRRSKPDPEGFRLAAQLLKVEPRECVVFEDSAAGVAAGGAAGMTVVGVGASEAAAAADWVIPDLRDATVHATPDGFSMALRVRERG